MRIQSVSPEWVEHGLAVGAAAQHRLVLDGRQVGPLLERREEAGDGHHQPGGLQATGGPEVPAEAHAIPVLVLLDELLVGHRGRLLLLRLLLLLLLVHRRGSKKAEDGKEVERGGAMETKTDVVKERKEGRERERGWLSGSL